MIDGAIAFAAPPGTGITGGLRAHPACLAALLAEKTVKEKLR
jgi:hypothetical protein